LLKYIDVFVYTNTMCQMQCIVYWGPQHPGLEGAPNHLAPTLGVIHIALCTRASWSNMICASTLRYVLSTHETTCAAHCNCCWFIM